MSGLAEALREVHMKPMLPQACISSSFLIESGEILVLFPKETITLTSHKAASAPGEANRLLLLLTQRPALSKDLACPISEAKSQF